MYRALSRLLSWLAVLMLLLPASASAQQEGDSPPRFESGERVPFRATLVPLVSLPASNTDDPVPAFAFNVIGRNHGLDGLEMGLVFNSERAYADGAQLTFGANWVSGPVRGYQGALGFNVSDDLDGVQTAIGGNLALGDVDGAQLGSINWATGRVDGLQLGYVNVAGDVAGVQGALLNVGGEVDGLQAGLVNIAKRSEVSLGLLNINWARPVWGLSWMNETGMVSVGLQHGSEHVYHILRAGYQPFESQRVAAAGIGFGGHFPLPAFGSLSSYLETEALYNVAVPLDTQTHIPSHWGQLRATFGLEFTRRLAAFAGLSANVIHSERRGRVLAPPAELPSVEVDAGVGFWPGGYLGVRF